MFVFSVTCKKCRRRTECGLAVKVYSLEVIGSSLRAFLTGIINYQGHTRNATQSRIFTDDFDARTVNVFSARIYFTMYLAMKK